MNDVNAFFEKIRSDKKLILIFLAGIIGVLLLLFSGSTNSEKTVDSQQNTEYNTVKPLSICSVDETERLLAEKVKGLVSEMIGVSSVCVAVTVASSGQYIYAENLKTERDDNTESVDREIVILSDDNTDPAVLLCIKAPEISGVAVVCQGGGSAVIKSEITQLVTSLFGIGSDKVYVGNKL